MREAATIRRGAVLALLALLLPLLPPLHDDAAEAAVTARRVVRCPEGACWPTAFDIAPDGRIWYVRRFSGQIRVFNPRTARDRLWRRIGGVATAGEQGLLGIALHPRWPDRRWVYVYYTKASPLTNRIIRMRKRPDGSFRTKGVLSIPAASHHNGGVIHFGPDGMLYAVTGDAGDPALAQSRSSRAGKVLRMLKSGRPPADNPFGNRTWSYGHRNSFGFAWDPLTDRLWQTENGPDCNDEINLIRRGRNYGWGPSSSCPNTNASGPDPVPPRRLYSSVIAPTGAAFCDRCRLGRAFEGTLLFGAWRDGVIRRLTLDDTRRGVTGSSRIYTHGSGILAMAVRSNGTVYFSAPEGIYRLRRA